MSQVLADVPAGGPVQGAGGLFALKASDSSAAGYGVVGISAAIEVLGDMRGTSPLSPTRAVAGVYGICDLNAGPSGAGVLGEGFGSDIGVLGRSHRGDGVHGRTHEFNHFGREFVNETGGQG